MYLFNFFLAIIILLTITSCKEDNVKEFNDITPMSNNQLKFGDMDGDGVNDIVIRDLNGFFIIKNNGNGYDNPILIYENHLTFAPMSIGDINGDGKNDIIGMIKSSVEINSGEYDYRFIGQLEVLINKGNGIYEMQSFKILPNEVDYSQEVRELYILDVDNDNLQDIVYLETKLGRTFINKISWYKNLGNLRFSNAKNQLYGSDIITQIFTDDFDGDGNDDYFLLKRYSEIQDPTNNINYGFNKTVDFEWSYALADFDNDESSDIVSYNKTDGIGIFKRSGNTFYLSSRDVLDYDFNTLGGKNKIHAGLVNDDEYPDIIINNGGVFTYFENAPFKTNIDGDNIWDGFEDSEPMILEIPIFDTDNKSYIHYFKDIDNDGDIDFIGFDDIVNEKGGLFQLENVRGTFTNKEYIFRSY